jgi:hypothetical protein
MSTTTILDYTTYGTAEGNYDGSSMDWASNGVQAAGYYRGHSGLQSVRYQLTDFVGTIYFAATLDETANDANWFTTITVGDGSTAISELRSQSIVGNFTWMRVRVEGFDSGTINYINITY